jgi:hypothetical protein
MTIKQCQFILPGMLGLLRGLQNSFGMSSPVVRISVMRRLSGGQNTTVWNFLGQNLHEKNVFLRRPPPPLMPQIYNNTLQLLPHHHHRPHPDDAADKRNTTLFNKS